jgi:lipid-binding SYLF domain-containing protein
MHCLRFFVPGIFLLGCACSVSPQTPDAKAKLHDDATAFMSGLGNKDPDLIGTLKTSAGYVVFPSIIKAGFGLEGAYGRGEVYQKGRQIGFADTTQYMIGAVAGGQAYGELIVFRNEDALENFKDLRATFAAKGSAIFAYYGAAAGYDYSEDVVSFSTPTIGFMFEGAIGLQTFDYVSFRPPASRVIVLRTSDSIEGQ